jgi:hypothetical protein
VSAKEFFNKLRCSAKFGAVSVHHRYITRMAVCEEPLIGALDAA